MAKQKTLIRVEQSGFEKINEFLLSVNESKRKSNDLLAQNIINAGYKIDYEKINPDIKLGEGRGDLFVSYRSC